MDAVIEEELTPTVDLMLAVVRGNCRSPSRWILRSTSSRSSSSSAPVRFSWCSRTTASKNASTFWRYFLIRPGVRLTSMARRDDG